MTARSYCEYSFVVEIISKANFCFDGILAKWFINFLAKKVDVHFNRICVGIKGTSPNFFHQGFLGNEFTLGLHQSKQYLVFTWGKNNFRVLSRYLFLALINDDITGDYVVDLMVTRSGLISLKQCMHPQ